MKRRSPIGFTLVELLVVIAIITLLVGGALISVTGTTGAAKLTTAGSRVAGWIAAARETAILKRQPVAVVMLVSGDAANRVFTSLTYAPPATAGGTGQWTQSAPWEILPQGVLLDSGLASTGNIALIPAGSPLVSPALPTLIYRNVSYPPRSPSGYGYMIFLPDGSLFQDTAGSLPTPCILRLVQGVVQGGNLQYGSSTSGGLSANYFEISLNQPTGQAKIIRP